MSTNTAIDVYDIVTSRIIELLEQGTIPWQKPWADAGIPMNLLSKRPYRGLNVWLLASLDYDQHLYLTWDQLKKIGGSVKQGEHGHVVVFWKNVPKKPQELDGGGNHKQVPILRYYKVFNVAQCRDIPEDLVPMKLHEEYDPIIECESLIGCMPQCPEIRHKEKTAFYHIAEDYINMPRKKVFTKIESYYLILFHELVHSTGHEKRLNRKTVNQMAEFSEELYSTEELVAELGACYLASFAGILNAEITNSAAYINGWLKRLREDKKLIVFAASHAQRAVDFILDKSETTEETTEKIDTPESVSEGQ